MDGWQRLITITSNKGAELYLCKRKDIIISEIRNTQNKQSAVALFLAHWVWWFSSWLTCCWSLPDTANLDSVIQDNRNIVYLFYILIKGSMIKKMTNFNANPLFYDELCSVFSIFRHSVGAGSYCEEIPSHRSNTELAIGQTQLLWYLLLYGLYMVHSD